MIVSVKTELIDIRVNASPLGIDFGANYYFSGKDILQADVEIGEGFDPTPASDIFGAFISAKSDSIKNPSHFTSINGLFLRHLALRKGGNNDKESSP